MVGIYKLKDYKKEKIDEVLNTIWEDLKVDEKIKEGMNVVIKPDLTIGNVEKDFTATNYLLIKCVAQKLQRLGANVVICDRTDGKFSLENIEEEYQKLNLAQFEDAGIKLNKSIDTVEADLNFEGNVEKLEMIKTIKDADYVINMPKLKTNLNFGLSGALCNMFGSITPESIKMLYSKYPENDKLSKLALMVSGIFKKQIIILDATVASDTDGMSNGDKVNFSHILASDDMYELDYIVSKKITKNPEKLPIIKAMLELKGKENFKNITLTGDSQKYFHAFKLPITINKLSFLDKITNKKIWPVIDSSKCIKCKICATRCPMDVIHEVDHLVKMDERYKCTRCMYCVDQCPCGAISTKYMKVKIKKNKTLALDKSNNNNV